MRAMSAQKLAKGRARFTREVASLVRQSLTALPSLSVVLAISLVIAR
jgi:hypothetical protein